MPYFGASESSGGRAGQPGRWRTLVSSPNYLLKHSKGREGSYIVEAPEMGVAGVIMSLTSELPRLRTNRLNCAGIEWMELADG